MFAFCSLRAQVTYDAAQFLEKNKDYTVAEHNDLLSASTDAFLRELFPQLQTAQRGKSKFSSLGSTFKVSHSACYIKLWSNLTELSF